jgi:hypothetical protein
MPDGGLKASATKFTLAALRIGSERQKQNDGELQVEL